MLRLLDKGTLRLLVDNQRIVDFQPELKDTLTRMYDNCPAKVICCMVDIQLYGNVEIKDNFNNEVNCSKVTALMTNGRLNDGCHLYILDSNQSNS